MVKVILAALWALTLSLLGLGNVPHDNDTRQRKLETQQPLSPEPKPPTQTGPTPIPRPSAQTGASPKPVPPITTDYLKQTSEPIEAHSIRAGPAL
jgi:hypothetical protein